MFHTHTHQGQEIINYVPNSEPNPNAQHRFVDYPYGSRQKRMQNFDALVEFLEKWKQSMQKCNKETENICVAIAERFCDMNFQYGHVTKKDITEQALMKVNLI
jgi:hypothetical protein